jgi:hypothetical protein
MSLGNSIGVDVLCSEGSFLCRTFSADSGLLIIDLAQDGLNDTSESLSLRPCREQTACGNGLTVGIVLLVLSHACGVLVVLNINMCVMIPSSGANFVFVAAWAVNTLKAAPCALCIGLLCELSLD